MNRALLDLDKTWSDVSGTFGTISIRIVVLKKKPSAATEAPSSEPSLENDDSDPLPESGNTPLDSYLERPVHGKLCTVFLVHGQRHHGWDNTFIVRDLGFKHLRNRTMVIVDIDGLAPEAIAEIVQGSRQGFYQGRVYDAIRDRIIATLKDDPDLLRLQAEAEQEIAELETGDQAVKEKLDQLIDDHHAAAIHFDRGPMEAGPFVSEIQMSFGKEKIQDVVVDDTSGAGDRATEPILLMDPLVQSIRLRPGVERQITIRAQPSAQWTNLEGLEVRTKPEIKELKLVVNRDDAEARIGLCFHEPSDFDDEDYPVITTLYVFARFRGYADQRMLKAEIIISKPTSRPPPPPPVLKMDPTFIRIVSRQPVKLRSEGPSTHVKVRWDGDDSLLTDMPPSWRIHARCLSIATYPPIACSLPSRGRFELLLDTPRGLLANQPLEFIVEAIGPAAKILTVTFQGEVTEPVIEHEPRKISASAPEAVARRRPPYELKYIKEDGWGDGTCWENSNWTEDDTGCFTEPTEAAPLPSSLTRMREF
jgi:hypothetical protein